MTVKEMIKILSEEFSPNLPVMIDVYEGGLREVKTIEFVNVALNVRKNNPYMGDHELASEDYPGDIKAVYIS